MNEISPGARDAIEKAIEDSTAKLTAQRPPISQATKAVDDTIEVHEVQRWMHAVNAIIRVLEQRGDKEFSHGDAVAMVNLKKWLDNVYSR